MTDIKISKNIEYWIRKGAKVLPAYLKSKKIALPTYKVYREIAPTEEEIQKWFPENEKKNVAVMMGPLNDGKILICLDLDDKKATEVVPPKLGFVNLEELAKHTRVEGHKDNPNSAHVFFIIPTPLDNEPLNSDETVPGIEVRATNKLTTIVAGSIHVDGYPYEVLGTEEIAERTDLQNILEQFYKEYNVPYMNNGITKKKYEHILKENGKTVTVTFDPTKKIPKRRRHPTLLSEFGREVQRSLDKSKEDLIKWALEKNDEWCQSPLEDSEVIEMMLYCIGEREKKQVLSVSQALRRDAGEEFQVKGTIMGIRPLFNMITSFEAQCLNCGNIVKQDLAEPVSSVKPPSRCLQCSEKDINIIKKNHCSVVTIELQNSDTFNDLEQYPVYLFDKDTIDIRPGEAVTIDGKQNIIESKGKKLSPCFYAKSIQYDESVELVLTPQDIDGIKRYVEYCKRKGLNVIDQLVKMYDGQIIGCELPKKGFLLSAVNSIADEKRKYLDNSRRHRIHSLLVGPPGLAKTGMLKAAVRMVPNSRYESAGGNASGRSLTAIVTKEGETHILRIGPVALARNHLCGLNELGRMDPEDQKYLLDSMEEGWISITKYGISTKIYSPTTIIASANPNANSNWNNDEIIDLNEIPTLKAILDRFDLWFVFRKEKDEKKLREYANKKGKLEKTTIPDYSKYLIKHIEYAKRLNPKISDEARSMLNEFYTKIGTRGFGSNRVLDTLCRLSEGVARLKLKDIADEEDAREVMEFYNEMLKNLEMTIDISANPKQVTHDKFVEILQCSKNMETQIHVGVTVSELHRIACKEDEQINSYLGPDSSTSTNKKLRAIITMLQNNSDIKQVGLNPVILKWSDGLVDLVDPLDQGKTEDKNKNSETLTKKDENKIIVSENVGSNRSNRSSRNLEYPEDCYYCDEVFNGIGKLGYEKHVYNEHPKMHAYPTLEQCHKNNVQPKGYWWEG